MALLDVHGVCWPSLHLMAQGIVVFLTRTVSTRLFVQGYLFQRTAVRGLRYDEVLLQRWKYHGPLLFAKKIEICTENRTTVRDKPAYNDVQKFDHASVRRGTAVRGLRYSRLQSMKTVRKVAIDVMRRRQDGIRSAAFPSSHPRWRIDRLFGELVAALLRSRTYAKRFTGGRSYFKTFHGSRTTAVDAWPRPRSIVFCQQD